MTTLKPRTKISEEMREKIIARLKETHSAARVAEEFKLSYDAAWTLAVTNGIDRVGKSGTGLMAALKKISDGMTLPKLENLLSLRKGTVAMLVHNPERVSNQWIRNTFIPKLLMAFPDKEMEITQFADLASQQRAPSVADVKRVLKGEKKKEVQKDFKEAAGILLRDLREECGQSIEAIQERLSNLIVKRNIARIEAGDGALAASIYREAILELCAVYKKIEPEKSAPYIRRLESKAHQLKT